MGWRDGRKYLQICTSYHEGGKSGSSKHGVPLELCHSSSGSISDIDSLSRRAERLTMLWIHGRQGSTTGSPCRAAVRICKRR
ncbi:hypothetical protein ARMGADRAFT_453757 [Armillaria gallica]|uniref:Uncharacterized protein n=1 Tax=Armillaria gallica TaxID=47427 RepID=A0A2H3CXL8_ARMGA|nr:hypothetical protein ARMGADRAFT_453757 [Armillaria gallica]